MASRRKQDEDRSSGSNTPSQQDEADIVRELGAEPAGDDGDALVVDEAKMLEAGAIDAESIRENRRIRHIVNKKRGGVKDVQINVEDLVVKYDTILKYWPANTLDISVRRRTGTAAQWVITTRPKSGADLYAALESLHGHSEETLYQVTFIDINKKEIRGIGSITMPDRRSTAPAPAPQGQPMQPPNPYGQPIYPPPAAQQQQPGPSPAQAAPPSVDPLAMMQSMFGIFQKMQEAARQQQPAQAPMQQPTPAMPPPPAQNDPMSMMAWMQECFRIFQQLQAPAQPPVPQPVGQAPATQADPMAMMQQMFQLFQQMQPPPQPAPPHPRASHAPQQPQTPAVNPMMMAMLGMPPMAPPPGTMWVPGMGFVAVDRLVQAIGGQSSGPAAAPYRWPHRPPYAQGDQGPQYPGHAPSPPPAPRSAADQFRDALTVVRTAVDVVQDLNGMLPNQQQPAEPQPVEEDDSPVKVIDTGPAKIVVNKRDGTLRGWETGWANMDKVLKWVGEQRESIQKANAERESAKQATRVQLPAGYVEVTPGYQPPPGYVAVPVDQLPPAAQQALPPPPQQVPPPIQVAEPSAPRRTWDIPTIPGGGD